MARALIAWAAFQLPGRDDRVNQLGIGELLDIVVG
jgi:hypothetical protein